MEWSDVLDAAMMVCFGISWPFAIAKLLRARKVHGVSLLFLVLVNIGYVAGIAGKLVRAHEEHAWPAWPTLIYVANALLVGAMIVLYLRFRDPAGRAGPELEPEGPGIEVREESGEGGGRAV
jgi:hypothetical protein